MRVSRTQRFRMKSRKGTLWLLVLGVLCAWTIIALLKPSLIGSPAQQTQDTHERRKADKMPRDSPNAVHNAGQDFASELHQNADAVAHMAKKFRDDDNDLSDVNKNAAKDADDSGDVASDIDDGAGDVKSIGDDVDDPVDDVGKRENGNSGVNNIKPVKIDTDGDDRTIQKRQRHPGLGNDDATNNAGNDVKHDVKGANIWAKDTIPDKGDPRVDVKRRERGANSDQGRQLAAELNLATKNAAIPRHRRRAIVYSCNKITICGGWADRQKGIVSAYVLAALLDRDFKLDMPRPCDISVYLQPNKVDWTLRDEDRQGVSTQDVEGIDSHGYDLVTRMLQLKDLQNLPELQADLVFITWNMELVHMLRTHPLALRLPWLDPKVSLAEVYRYVLALLFKPSPHLQAKIDDLSRRRPENTQLACAQIRMGGSQDFHDSETFNSMRGVENLVDFLKQYNDPLRYRILFASDNVQALTIGEQNFPQTFMQSSGPITHVDKYKGQDACAGFGRAILDQVMLASCDVLVISESGLGKIAAYLRNTDENLFLFHDSKVSVFRRDLRFPNRFFW